MKTLVRPALPLTLALMLFTVGCARTILDLPLRKARPLPPPETLVLGIYGGEAYFPYRDWGEDEDILLNRLAEANHYAKVIRIPPRYVFTGDIVRVPPAAPTIDEVRAIKDRYGIDLLIFYCFEFLEKRVPLSGNAAELTRNAPPQSRFEASMRTSTVRAGMRYIIIDPGSNKKVCKIWEPEQIEVQHHFTGDGPIHFWGGLNRSKPCEWTKVESALRVDLINRCINELNDELGHWLGVTGPTRTALRLSVGPDR
ncbi:hypothetical protein ACFL4G_00775 [Thermodesulfobacteriota bacterium]